MPTRLLSRLLIAGLVISAAVASVATPAEAGTLPAAVAAR